jgi:hypothetical protein
VQVDVGLKSRTIRCLPTFGRAPFLASTARPIRGQCSEWAPGDPLTARRAADVSERVLIAGLFDRQIDRPRALVALLATFDRKWL